MTDPPATGTPGTDGEVPGRFLDLIDEILDTDEFRSAPSPPAERRTTSEPAKRIVVYAAIAAAAVALAIVGVAALRDSNTPSVDTERAANPTTPATPGPGVAGDGNGDRIVADAEIAAGFGLTLGPQVFRDDGSFVLADQPDLTPVYNGDELVGYVHRRDVDPANESTRFVVFGPDGVTVRGVFDQRTGFIASTDPAAEGD